MLGTTIHTRRMRVVVPPTSCISLVMDARCGVHFGQILMIAICGMLGYWQQYWGARSMLHPFLGTNA